MEGRKKCGRKEDEGRKMREGIQRKEGRIDRCTEGRTIKEGQK